MNEDYNLSSFDSDYYPTPNSRDFSSDYCPPPPLLNLPQSEEIIHQRDFTTDRAPEPPQPTEKKSD